METKNNYIKIIFLIMIFSFISSVFWSYVFNIFFKNTQIITSSTKQIKQETKLVNIKDLQSQITQVVDKMWPSVVNVIIKKDLPLYRQDPFWFFREQVWSVTRQIWGWSGFIISKNGYILTNKHVVSESDSTYTVITNDQKEYDAKIIAIDKMTDLAILKIESQDEFTPLKSIQSLDNLRIWEFVIAIWNALAEFQNSVSFWVLSWKNRTIEAWTQTQTSIEKLTWLLQTDAAINPWNSWWPLLNLDGEVIWINTAIAWNGQGLWFSIPLTQKRIDYILSSISKYNTIKRPFIWINYISLNSNIANQLWLKSEYWAYLQDENSILKDSPAYDKWLKSWDIILEINKEKITQTNNIPNIIQNNIPWDKVNLKVLSKDWKINNIEIILAEGE